MQEILMKRISILPILSCIAVACGAVGCTISDPVAIARLHGLTEEAVIEELGQPVSSKQYTMGEAIGEFRIALQNTYPLSHPRNAQIEIKELWWNDGNYINTVWLHVIKGKWVVLDTLRWHKEVEF
jgi:hypothetical protein